MKNQSRSVKTVKEEKIICSIHDIQTLQQSKESYNDNNGNRCLYWYVIHVRQSVWERF